MATDKQPRLSRPVRAQVTRAKWRLTTVEQKEFESKSQPGMKYKARVMVDGKTTCNCRGWVVKREGRPRQCRHTKTLIAGRPTQVRGDFLYIVGFGKEKES